MAQRWQGKVDQGEASAMRGEAWQSGGREKQSIARNRHGVDLRSKAGHRQRIEGKGQESLRTAQKRKGFEWLCRAKAKRGKGQRRRCGDLIGTAKKNKNEKKIVLDNREIWVAEYSLFQNAFHVEPIQEMLRNNREIILNQNGVDYIPFAIVGSHHSANIECEKMKQFLREKGR